MSRPLIRKKVMVACVTGEVTQIVQPATMHNVDRIHLVHYIKNDADKDERTRFYRKIYEETERVLKEAGIEVSEHSEAKTYRFDEMMAEVYDILCEEVGGNGSDVYINLSSGTPEFAAAAAICGMMYKEVRLLTATKGYQTRTLTYDQLLENATTPEGKLVGSCTDISGMYEVQKYPIDKPDENLLRAFKVFVTVTDAVGKGEVRKNSNSVIIRNLILKGIWLSDNTEKEADKEKERRRLEMVRKGTSVELESPDDGYRPEKYDEEYRQRQRREAVQYLRTYVDKWRKNSWIEPVGNTKKYKVTDEGRNVYAIFCSDRLLEFGEEDIVVQKAVNRRR